MSKLRNHLPMYVQTLSMAIQKTLHWRVRGLRVGYVALVMASLLAVLLVGSAPASSVWSAARRIFSASHLNVTPSVVNETLNPGDPPLTTSAVTIMNNGAGVSNWSISASLPSWLSITPLSGTLNPGASTSPNFTFTALSSTPQTLSTTLSISDPNASNSPVSLPVTLSIGNYSRTWYFAEGFTGGSFTEYLTLANPNPNVATVTVQYLLQGGIPLTQTYSILSNSRYTINVNKVVGLGWSVALAITSDLPIIAERPMYFTYGNIPGGSDTVGATSLGTTFAFAYLDTTVRHDTYLTMLNQNSVPIQALVQYYPAGGGTAINRLHTIAARSRGTIKVNSEGLGGGTFSAIVTLSAVAPNTQTPALGLVERPMYLVDGVTGYTGSSDVIGLSTGSTNWDFAEGYTGSTFSERYILANPFSATATRATITFYLANGSSVQQVVALQPGQQQIVNVNGVLGSNGVNNSANISSDQPILAERFMSFSYGHIPGATDVLGAQQPSDLYYFAEGFTGGHFSEYLTVENPNESSVSLQVTFLPASGTPPTVKTYSLLPTSRFTLLTNQIMPGQSFSMVVQASAAIVAERPMYFAYGSQTGGTDVIGYAPHGPSLNAQGYCPTYCLFVTTDSLNSGGLDETTGLLEWNYQSDSPAFGKPYIDPYSGAALTTLRPGFGSSGTQVELVANQGNGYPLWSYYPGSGYLDGYGVGGAITPFISGANGRDFFAVSPFGTSPTSTLFAVDSYAGTTDWTASIAAFMDTNPFDDGSGTLYVTDNSRELYSFNDSTGVLNWKVSLGSQYAYSSASAVAGVQNGLAYTGVYGQSTTTIEALHTSDGSVAWSYSVPSGGSHLLLSGSTIYADDGNGNIYALDANTGAVQWNTTSNNMNIETVNSEQLVSFNYATATIQGMSLSDGSILWQFPLSTTDYLVTPFVLTSSYDPNGPSAYFGALDNSSNKVTIYAINATNGTVEWQFQPSEPYQYNPFSSLPSLGVSYTGVFYTYYTATAIFVYGLDLTRGTQMWKTELDIPPNQYSPIGGMSVGGTIGVSSYIASHKTAKKPRKRG